MSDQQQPLLSATRFSIGQKSDVGQVRDNNQDALSVFVSSTLSSEEYPDFGLFIVADGMGGHVDGGKASSATTRIVAHDILSHIFVPLLGESNHNPNAYRTPLAESLSNAVLHANEHVFNQLPGSGTTITAITIIGDLAYVAHAGDSRAYLIQPNSIEQLTRDHSMVQRLIELGQFTAEEAAGREVQNALYRAIGIDELLEVDIVIRSLARGSYLLLCSDGLWNYLSDAELQDIVLEHGTNPQLACAAMVDLANERGGEDNISVIVVQVQ